MLYTCILISLDQVSRTQVRQFHVVPDERLSMIKRTDTDLDGIAEIAYKVGKLASVGAWVPSRTRLQSSTECNKIMHGPFIDPDLVCATIVLDGQREQIGLYPVDNDSSMYSLLYSPLDSRIVLANNDVLVHDYRQTPHYINTGTPIYTTSIYTTLTLFYRRCR